MKTYSSSYFCNNIFVWLEQQTDSQPEYHKDPSSKLVTMEY